MNGFGAGVFGGGLFGAGVTPPGPPQPSQNDTMCQMIALVVLVASGLVAGSVVWTDQIRPYVPVPARALIRLSLLPSDRAGYSDDTDYMPSPDGTQLVQVTSGRRYVALTIACDSYEQSNDRTAFAYLERIRTRMAWDSNVLALASAGVIVVDEFPITPIPTTVDGREVSSAAYDSRISYVVVDSDDSNPIDWIETVDISQA